MQSVARSILVAGVVRSVDEIASLKLSSPCMGTKIVFIFPVGNQVANSQTHSGGGGPGPCG